MKPVLAVCIITDSFRDEWSELAAACGADVCLVDGPAELRGRQGVCAVVVATAGEEVASMALVAELRAICESVAVVGSATDYRVVASLLRSGAGEYFALPGDWSALRSWVAQCTDRVVSAGRARDLAALERNRYDFSRLIGQSPALRRALARTAKVVARESATVLISGETGTGKDLLAQAIHHNGPRASRPFVQVNCAALPAPLLESELFGHERGAFTDAKTAKPGLFEVAAGGTLFLDEVGDLPLALQPKLLRVLEDHRVRRVGAVRETEVDVRIIAATHAPLAESVRDGRFRDDLYYRLSVIPIHLPPLRERADDVLLLADHFVARFAAQHALPRSPIAEDVRRALLGHPWPGNVRELRNAIERSLLLGDGELSVDDLVLADSGYRENGSAIPFPAPLADIERAAARAMVERLHGNKSAAADALGISRSRLYALLDGPPGPRSVGGNGGVHGAPRRATGGHAVPLPAEGA